MRSIPLSLPLSLAFALAIPALSMAGPETTRTQTELFFSALENGDLKGVESMLAPDVVNTLPYDASGATTEDAFRVFDGRDQVMAYFSGASALIPEVAFVDPEITISVGGETAFVENRGDMVLADGRSYQNLYVWRLDFSGDKIIAITEYFNPVTAALAFDRPVGAPSAE